MVQTADKTERLLDVIRRKNGQYEAEDEQLFLASFRELTDEEVFAFIKGAKELLGRLPVKADIPAFYALKQRFGPWPRMLEKAGVKPLSETKIRREKAKKAKRSGK